MLFSPGNFVLGTDAIQSSLYIGVLNGNIVHLKTVLAQTLLALVFHKTHQRGEKREVPDLHFQGSPLDNKLGN